MNSAAKTLMALLVLLVALAATAPLLIRLSHALVPLVIAAGVVAVVVRLVLFHTRNW